MDAHRTTKPEVEAGADRNAAHEVRCECGSLLARLVEGGVELKCRRCKRSVIVPLVDWEAGEEDAG